PLHSEPVCGLSRGRTDVFVLICATTLDNVDMLDFQDIEEPATLHLKDPFGSSPTAATKFLLSAFVGRDFSFVTTLRLQSDVSPCCATSLPENPTERPWLASFPACLPVSRSTRHSSTANSGGGSRALAGAGA